jgi:hypothetical protein
MIVQPIAVEGREAMRVLLAVDDSGCAGDLRLEDRQVRAVVHGTTERGEKAEDIIAGTKPLRGL